MGQCDAPPPADDRPGGCRGVNLRRSVSVSAGHVPQSLTALLAGAKYPFFLVRVLRV